MTTAPTTPIRAPSKWRRRLKRAALVMLITAPVAVIALWSAVHYFPWMGPLVADTLRAIIGTDNVSRLEDFVYGVEDRWNRWWRADEAPKAYWEVPTSEPLEEPAPSASADVPALPPFRPADVGPMHKALAAEGDGKWVAVPDPLRPGKPILMHKTLVHPDPKRPWAELFVVALDLRRIDLRAVAGTSEPVAHTPEGRSYQRHGLIPSDDRDSLLAAFNGGFKAEHGRWGMRIDGVTLIEPRKHGCTLVKKTDGQLRILPWPEAETDANDSHWWRQTPPCMYLDGKRHGGLWDPDAKGWGAALEGDTVIRRSAIGLDEARTTLYVSMSNHTSARAIADGMHHVGATTVAQLDVNWSFPRFVLFPEEAGQRKPTSLFAGFEIADGEFIREPNGRDFFYVLRTDL